MDRPNILLVSFDDAVAPWPYKTAFGEPLQTPNIDRLCATSTAFHSACAQAPICGPSRASFMTTMMPPEIGILDNTTFVFDKIPPQMAWSFCLKQNGYFCSSGGKVHHRFKPLQRGHHRVLYSDQRKAFSDDMGLPREMWSRARRYGGHRKGWATLDPADDGFYYDAQSADSAVGFLESYDGPQPFYREVGFFSPHVPQLAPARFRDLYDPEKLRKPADWTGYVDDNPYVRTRILENPDLRSESWWQKTVRNYFSAYSHGDHHLGRVLDALAGSRHAANTIVILVSDHGFHLGNRNLFRKTTMWEQSLNVPFVIHDPRAPQGRVVDDPVALIDLGPTVLDFAGIAPPDRRHGRSLRPWLSGARDPDRVVPSFYTRNATVRRGRFRIIRYGDGSFQLFDVEEDYWQLRDLGTEHAAFAGLQELLVKTMADCGFDPDAEAAVASDPAVVMDEDADPVEP
ncbi:MAG: sulfatase-like hydrolase/transferase [Rhodobacterales bacterium]|nr:sulfatase-like hydrolase/transferase [Rhodobacterales bacterium]